MPELCDKSDLELLLEYSSGRNQAAFEVLVCRHGSMVNGVARRVLRNHHDAQDVTQATFLVLAREASKLRKGDCLAGWLHTVARRLSLNALKSRKAREAREQTAMDEKLSTATTSAELQADFREELDAALSSLPERYRQPLVLFHLEGASIEEASKSLKLHSGTFRTRLGRARALLRDALVRHGVKVTSGSMLAAMLAAESKAAALDASGVLEISQAVLGKAAMASRAQALADGLGIAQCASTTSFSTALITIMTTKTSLIAAAAVALAAIVTSAKLLSEKSAANEPKDINNRVAQDRSGPRGFGPQSATSRVNTLEQVSSSADFRRLLRSVFMVADEGERLQAIRQRLGINISNEAYRLTLEECRYEPDPRRQFRILMSKWIQEDGAAAMQWADAMPEELKMNMSGYTLCLWMALDQTAATAWAEANMEPKMIDTVLGSVSAEELEIFTITAEQVPGYLASSLVKGQGSNGLGLREVIRYVGFKNPEATHEFLHTSGVIEDDNYRRYIERFFGGWAGSDPDAALAAVLALPQGSKLRSGSLLKVLERWQRKYPERSMDEVANLSELSDQQFERLSVAVAAIVAQVDPVRAMQRAFQQESPDMRKEMIEEVASVWADLSQDEATRWLLGLPQGEQQDMGFGALAKTVSVYDYEQGIRLISKITDPGRREEAVRGALGQAVWVERRDDELLLTGGTIEDVMRMADLSPMMPVGELNSYYANMVQEDQAPMFLDWIRKRGEEGRIRGRDKLELERMIGSIEARLEQKE